MKCKDVLKTLDITRTTLHNYVKQNKISYVVKSNGQYDYNDDDVFVLLNKNIERKTYVYARVSTNKQKSDLQSQIDLLTNFCYQNGFKIDGIFKDIASGISFSKRENFFVMLDDIIDGKVKRVVITYKDRLSRVGFELFSHLFKKYGCEIAVINEMSSDKLDSQEIFEEIVSLLHCYSMKLYSSRRVKKIKEIAEGNEEDEGSKS